MPVLIVALALGGLVAWRQAGKRVNPSTSTLLTVASPPAQEGAAKDGMFKITPQGDKTPMVAIINRTEDQLRLRLMDSVGIIRTEWIAPYAERDLQVQAGNYSASVDAPYDDHEIPTDGTVDVQEYHHYQADFVLVPDTGAPSSFHIGD